MEVTSVVIHILDWLPGGQVLTANTDCEDKKLDAFATIESADVIAVCKPKGDCGVSISLGADTIREIEKLEQYAILAGHRIGEFRVG